MTDVLRRAAAAGVDLGIPTEVHADRLAHRIARELHEAGVVAVTVCTHRIVDSDHTPHVALSVEQHGIPPATAFALLVNSLDHELDGGAVCLTDLETGRRGARAIARAAAAVHEHRHSGRAAYYPGIDELVGLLSVGDVLARSAIDRVRVLAGDVAPAASNLDTHGFVRPRFEAGDLVLAVQPAAGGVLVPFEVAAPTPCCAHH